MSNRLETKETSEKQTSRRTWLTSQLPPVLVGFLANDEAAAHGRRHVRMMTMHF